MRLLHRAERSYVGRIIKDTRLLVNSNHAVHTKIALIESAIAEESDRIVALEYQLHGAEPALQSRLQKVIELRRRALGHYRSTVKALLLREKRSMALRRLPTFLSGGPPTREQGREAPGPGDHPFMEFSS